MIYYATYRRRVLYALSFLIIFSCVVCCAPSSSAEDADAIYDALNGLLFAENSGFLVDSYDLDFCMEIAQKVFEAHQDTVKAGCPRVSPNMDMIFIPFTIGSGSEAQYRYLVMRKSIANAFILMHNHSEESFLGLMKGLYDISFYFVAGIS